MSTAAPPAPGPELRAAYAACARLQRRHDPTYYWATRRLPRRVRPATHALYGYVRTADELVDGPGRPTDPAERRAALDAWEAELARGRRGEPGVHPIVGALTDAAGRHDLPLHELERYMHSMRVDCGPVRMRSYAQLEDYMEGSAGSVGRIMAPLLGVPEAEQPAFGRLGLAFQLTNFLRDVKEDRALGRVYLPEEDLEAAGAAPEDLDAPRAGAAVREVVLAQVDRARRLFAGTEPAIAATPRSVQPGIRVALLVYQRVLDQIEATGGDVLGAGTRPPRWRVALALPGAMR